MHQKIKKGFTLVEMLVVIAIIGILLAIAVPIYSTVVENARVREFEANHNMIVASINMYTAAHNGAYPTHAESLNPYLYGGSGSTTSLDALTTPEGAVYEVTFKDAKNRPVIRSSYNGHELPAAP